MSSSRYVGVKRFRYAHQPALDIAVAREREAARVFGLARDACAAAMTARARIAACEAAVRAEVMCALAPAAVTAVAAPVGGAPPSAGVAGAVAAGGPMPVAAGGPMPVAAGGPMPVAAGGPMPVAAAFIASERCLTALAHRRVHADAGVAKAQAGAAAARDVLVRRHRERDALDRHRARQRAVDLLARERAEATQCDEAAALAYEARFRAARKDAR